MIFLFAKKPLYQQCDIHYNKLILLRWKKGRSLHFFKVFFNRQPRVWLWFPKKVFEFAFPSNACMQNDQLFIIVAMSHCCTDTHTFWIHDWWKQALFRFKYIPAIWLPRRMVTHHNYTHARTHTHKTRAHTHRYSSHRKRWPQITSVICVCWRPNTMGRKGDLSCTSILFAMSLSHFTKSISYLVLKCRIMTALRINSHTLFFIYWLIYS